MLIYQRIHVSVWQSTKDFSTDLCELPLGGALSRWPCAADRRQRSRRALSDAGSS